MSPGRGKSWILLTARFVSAAIHCTVACIKLLVTQTSQTDMQIRSDQRELQVSHVLASSFGIGVAIYFIRLNI